MKTKISYGKNVYDNKEISAVLRTLRKSTQMGDSVNSFEKKISKLFQLMSLLLRVILSV